MYPPAPRRAALSFSVLIALILFLGGHRAAVIEPLAPFTATVLPSGDARIEIDVLPGTYNLLASEDLQNWVILDTFCSTDGRIRYLDEDPPPKRFYQLVCLDLGNLLPTEIAYRGDTAIFTGGGFTPGAVIGIDIDNNGSTDQSATVDASGFATFVIDTSALPANHTASYTISSGGSALPGFPATLDLTRTAATNPAAAVPVCLSPEPEPNICLCAHPCPDDIFLRFTNTFTPSFDGVDLATGKLRYPFTVTESEARLIDFSFVLFHTSLVDYDGPWGKSMSHNMNLMLVRSGPLSGSIVTPDLRIYPISSVDGINWSLPDGFYSRLTYDGTLGRWLLTHNDGQAIEFYEGALSEPGYPIRATEPNGNVMTLSYDGSGLLEEVKTTLGQPQALSFDASGRLQTFSDHLGHTWTFFIDPGTKQLTQVDSPAHEHVTGPAGQLITDDTLAGNLATLPRSVFFSWHTTIGAQLASITDGRGATPFAATYDGSGRVDQITLNGNAETIDYAPAAGPVPLTVLDAGNKVVRVTDREGNITDYEIHGPAGGPVGGKGVGGLRRTIDWTETGKGNPPLRTGEPNYYEARVLHDCDCLKPHIVAEAFSSTTPGLAFDANGMPTNWPRVIYTHNSHRQVTQLEVTDGANSVTVQNTYQANAFGDADQFSRLLTTTDPRAFDPNPIYTGLDFEHEFTYDTRGNMLTHHGPDVTLGQPGTQTVTEVWEYNKFGQTTSYTDPNGNITTTEYYAGASTGGTVNTAGSFGGYPRAVTIGAAGSADAAPGLRTEYEVNALGQFTRVTDPRGLVHTRTFNELGDLVALKAPPVDLGGPIANHETRFYYDAAGNTVLYREANIEPDGTTNPNAWIDQSFSFDDIGNMLASRTEVDNSPANDLIVERAYDRNDQVSVIQMPEGNRKFYLYDERQLPFKTFFGIEPGASVTASYPLDKKDTALGGTSFVGLTSFNYDERGNQNEVIDARGNEYTLFHDFLSRVIATSDQNGNGITVDYDHASNPLRYRSGEVDKSSGAPLSVGATAYLRFDEAGRQYLTARDLDPTSDESANLDPGAGINSGFHKLFDPGGRALSTTDAGGNTTSGSFDAADRLAQRLDPMGNVATFFYDENSNLVRVEELDTPGPGATGPNELHVTEFVFDELNRIREEHILGENGSSIDHATQYFYDSRNNIRVIVDPEGNASVNVYDDLDRRIMFQSFDANPLVGPANELERSLAAYDGNSNRVSQTAIGDITNPGVTEQTTHYAYDDYDRMIRAVYPDSDDPIDGSGNGTDAIFDRIEVGYDANSNAVTINDQRGVLQTRGYDPGNRLAQVQLTLPGGVPGETLRVYTYDRLDRMVRAHNDFADVEFEFDPLSRVIAETQSIRLDGQGHTMGYQFPIRVEFEHDKDSNLTVSRVLDGAATDLEVAIGRDALHRTESLDADYFGLGPHPVASYAYFGRFRLQSCTLGNGASHENTFDTKRRLSTCQWSDTGGNLLAGFAYGYDDVDNALFEQVLHDGGRYDHFQYDARYQLTGTTYRDNSPAPPIAFANSFIYDSNFNRQAATFQGPMGGPATNDVYTKGGGDEYNLVTRDTNPAAVMNDLTGNTTETPVRPVLGPGPNTNDQPGQGVFDGFNQLFAFQTPFSSPTPTRFRSDALGRRIATIDDTTPVRRYIYGDSRTLAERTFNPGATLGNAPSTLERIYVDGLGIDEHVLCAIDRDGDGLLGAPNTKNEANPGSDQEYYYLLDRLRSTAALLDADTPSRIMEYVRHSAFGEPTVMPIVDGDLNGREDTPGDLSDNAANQDRASLNHGNAYFHAGRRWDHELGLYYNRARHYEPGTGRFLERDPLGYSESLNLHAYAVQNPVNRVDPFGGHSVSASWKVRTYNEHPRDKNRTKGGELNVDRVTASLRCGPCANMKTPRAAVPKDADCEIVKTFTQSRGRGRKKKSTEMAIWGIKGRWQIINDIKLTVHVDIIALLDTMRFNKKEKRGYKSGDKQEDIITLGANDYANAEIRHAQQLAEFLAGGNPDNAFPNPGKKRKNPHRAKVDAMWKALRGRLRRETGKCPFKSKETCEARANAVAKELSAIANRHVMGKDPDANDGRGNGLWNGVIDTFGRQGSKGYPDLPLEQSSRDYMVEKHDSDKTGSKHIQRTGTTGPYPPPKQDKGGK